MKQIIDSNNIADEDIFCVARLTYMMCNDHTHNYLITLLKKDDTQKDQNNEHYLLDSYVKIY